MGTQVIPNLECIGNMYTRSWESLTIIIMMDISINATNSNNF